MARVQGVGCLELAAVDRVVAEVGAKYVHADFYRAGLLRCLNLCSEWYREAVAHSSNKPEIERTRRLALIRKTAKRLEQLLGRPETLWHHPRTKKLAPTIPGVTLKTLLNMVDGELVPPAPHIKSYFDSFKQRSPFESLVGNFLADAFELTFQRNTSLSQNGPFVRFAEAVLAELKITNHGKPYSRASIAKALKNQRMGVLRRARVPYKKDHYRWWRRALLTQAYLQDRVKPDEAEPGAK